MTTLATATTTVDTEGDTESLHERRQSLVQQHKPPPQQEDQQRCLDTRTYVATNDIVPLGKLAKGGGINIDNEIAGHDTVDDKSQEETKNDTTCTATTSKTISVEEQENKKRKNGLSAICFF